MKSVALLIGLSLALTPAAAAAKSNATLADIEDEVMCPICGTLLELSQSPQAEREKAFISSLIARGRTKAQIKDALVAEYGREVLALPRGTGFDLSAYLVPAIAFVVAAIALGVGVVRWRRDYRASDAAPGPTAAPPDQEDAKRLDADLSKYDL